MEVEEQSDQTNNSIETSQEQQTDNMTVPDTANHDLYADTQVTNDTKDAIKDCAANVELNGYEDSQINSVNTDSHIRQYAVNMDSHISVEADSLRTELKGNDDEIAMETEVTEGNDEDLGEDGEILEDGEIASDQDGELKDEEDDDSKSKSSPTKSKGGHHGEERDRKGKRKERHSKRRRSKEDSHRDKQTKKKRHREYTDYDKTGDEFDQSWSGGEKRDKSEKKGNKSPSAAHHSPSHDNQGEDRGKSDKDHRRGSNDRHHSGGGRDRDKHRGRDRDHNSDKKGKERSPKDKRDKQDKKDRERQSRNSRDSKEKDRKNNSSDNYESPPGIYDSPSDDETNDNRFGGSKGATLMSMVEGEYLDSSVAPTDNVPGPLFPKNKKKQQRKKEWLERKQQREREMEEEKPPKKKPLLQTPMEERPQCRFFKEGKCQKGSDCPFNHGFRPAKRLEVCKYYVQSTCWNQGECVFMHEEFPCKYFHTGSTCYQGDNCKFSHDPLTEETQIALDNAMADRGDFEDCMDEPRENKKYKKKGLLGDQPPLSEEELHRKLESMKKIPSIFDIETHAPGESPRKPPGQSPSMGRPQGFYQDNSMSPGQSGPGPNMNFQGNRPPFMQGSGGPGMDGPPPGMQGPPMGGPGFMGGPGMQGPGMPGPGPGPQGPGMQGAPMGPPMNNQMNPAAALVGAILRAAPMLQQYRGPAPQGPTPNSTAQGPPTSMPNMIDPRFGPQTMGPMPGPNMMGQEQNMGPSASPRQEGNATAVDDDQNNQESELSSQNFAQSKQAQASRDPRKGASHSSNTNSEDVSMDTDMRDLGDVDLRGQGHGMGDVDLRQDIDMRQDEKGNQGNTTPQQEWDDDKISNNVDDEDESLDIPEHLPPKQREMFMRIKQMSMKIKKDQSLATKNASKQAPKDSPSKTEDDKWYSSDEEDDKQSSSNQSEINKEPRTYSNSSMSSSLNVMQMINAAKSSTQSSTQQRPQDPRRQLSDQTSAKSPPQEPVVIHSCDGDAPWRLIRVVYVKQKVPTNINLNDPKYKADPRVQKMLKMQELEFGKIIDHSKTNVKVETSPTIEPKLPDLLDPKVFKQLPRPELAPFIDPRSKKENSDPRIKQEPGSLSKSVSNKPMDPRVQKQAAMHNLPGKPMDPRLARQDSSSGNLSMSKSSSRPLDPRIGRQTSSGSPTYSANIPPLSSTPPLDPRMMNRQSSSDPRLSKTDITSTDPSMLGKPLDPRLGRVVGSDLGPPSVHRQFSNPGTREERDAASSSEQKTKVDYRNDPRFKRKHISESNLSPTSAGKRFPEQRKTTTEYSSPLGGESSQSEDSGYNSYNRQRVSKQTPQHSLQKLSESVPMPSEEISTHDILDSLQIMSPPVLEKPDKNLKDIFKTIDPTASPFC